MTLTRRQHFSPPRSVAPAAHQSFSPGTPGIATLVSAVQRCASISPGRQPGAPLHGGAFRLAACNTWDFKTFLRTFSHLMIVNNLSLCFCLHFPLLPQAICKQTAREGT